MTWYVLFERRKPAVGIGRTLNSDGDRSDAGLFLTGAVCSLSAEPEQRISVPFEVTDRTNPEDELYDVFI